MHVRHTDMEKLYKILKVVLLFSIYITNFYFDSISIRFDHKNL